MPGTIARSAIVYEFGVALAEYVSVPPELSALPAPTADALLAPVETILERPTLGWARLRSISPSV